ncbi:MAG: hypothetical protein WCA46_29215 [Actinocatenispora sp.]
MPHRLWFRLDDVLPLAEHALACPAHRITRAQVLAHAPLRPALVVAGTPPVQVLVSNGLPAWYSDRGAAHGVSTYTWRHTHDTPQHHNHNHNHNDSDSDSDQGTGYLPLGVTSGPGSVIGMLRDARHTGRHWVTIDLDPANGHLITPDHVQVTESRDNLAPADAHWIPATVTAQPVAHGTYPALVPDGYTTDVGFVIPRFDRATVEQIIADLAAIHTNPDMHRDPMPGEYPHLWFTGEVLIVLDEHDDGLTTTYHETDRVHPDLDGRYALGAYTWPWRRTRN